jgi:hypothetical protein
MAEPPLPGPGRQLDLLRDRLRRLHLHAGKPSTREIARHIGSSAISHTTVHSVLRCARCPRWGNLELIVEALGGDIEEFRLIWMAMQESSHLPAAGHTEAAQRQSTPGGSSAIDHPREPIAGIDYSKSSAILIGVSHYRDASFAALPSARNSLTGMAQALTDPNIGGWPEGRVSVFQDPNDVRDLVRQLRAIAWNTTELLILYHVGHGALLRRGELAFALSDTLSDHPDITGLEFSRVREVLLDSPARV